MSDIGHILSSARTVLRLNAATARVRFREFHNTYLDYAVKHSRLFIPSPTAD